MHYAVLENLSEELKSKVKVLGLQSDTLIVASLSESAIEIIKNNESKIIAKINKKLDIQAVIKIRFLT